MKKYLKIFAIILLVMLVAVVLSTTVYAREIGGVNIDPNAGTAGDTVGTIGNTVIGIIQVVGIVIAVAVLVVIGIKYMMGSAEEKAEYKKTLLPYIIGAVLIAAAPFIAQMIFGWGADINNLT